jgi:hypothetical protein
MTTGLKTTKSGYSLAVLVERQFATLLLLVPTEPPNFFLPEMDFVAFGKAQVAFNGFTGYHHDEIRRSNESLVRSIAIVDEYNISLLAAPIFGKHPTLPPAFNAANMANSALDQYLVDIGPDYFFGHVLVFSNLQTIASSFVAAIRRQGLEVILSYKSMEGILTKLYVRGKDLKDMVRSTVLIDRHEDLIKFLEALESLRVSLDGNGINLQYFVDPPSRKVWPVCNIYLWDGDRQIGGQHSFFEIQILPTQTFLELKQSTNHEHYEILRSGLSEYQRTVTAERVDMLTKLGEHIGKNLLPDLSHFTFGQFRIGRSAKPNVEIDNQFVVEQCLCREVLDGQPIYFDFDWDGESHAIHPYITNGKLRVGDYVALWSENTFDLRGKTVTFNFSVGLTGSVILALGTERAKHGNSPGDNVTLNYGGGSFWIRKSIFNSTVAYESYPKVAEENCFAAFSVSNRKDSSKGWKVTLRVGAFTAETFLSSPTLRIGILSWVDFSDAEIRSIRIH